MPLVAPVGLWRVTSLTRRGLSNPNKGKCDIGYYINLERYFADMGVQYLTVKDMTGLLNPHAATILVSELREDIPDMHLHIHTHDTVGTVIDSMIASTNAGADVVYASTDAMYRQPSQLLLGGISATVCGTNYDAKFDPYSLGVLNICQENVCFLYFFFKSGQLS